MKGLGEEHGEKTSMGCASERFDACYACDACDVCDVCNACDSRDALKTWNEFQAAKDTFYSDSF